VETGHQITKLLLVHAELSNTANPDVGKFPEVRLMFVEDNLPNSHIFCQWTQELKPHLLRMESCEMEAANALREVGIMHPRTTVTQKIVDVSIFLSLSLRFVLLTSLISPGLVPLQPMVYFMADDPRRLPGR
jgi:hypothetical protein